MSRYYDQYAGYPAPRARGRSRRNRVNLPQEIIDTIITEARDHAATLKSFSFVSKACKYQSHKYLFNTVEITVAHPTPQRRLWDLAAILSKNPQIATHIHTLFVVGPQYLPHPPGKLDVPAQSWLWMTTDYTLHKVLQFLGSRGHIVHFNFVGEFDWSMLLPTFTRAVWTILNNPNLVSFSLANLSQVPMACFTAACAHAKQLTLVNDFVKRDHQGYAPPPATSSCLEILHLEYLDAKSTRNFLNAVLPVSRSGARDVFPALRALRIGTKTQDAVSALAEVVHAGRYTIAHFAWECKHGPDFGIPLDLEPLDLGPLRNLVSIDYEVACVLGHQAADIFSGLRSLLGTVNRTNIIDGIFITVVIPNMSMATGHLEYYTDLDTKLASSTFKNVTNLSFRFDLWSILTVEEENHQFSGGRMQFDIRQLAYERKALLGRHLWEKLPRWLATRRVFNFSLCVAGRKVD